MFPKSPTSKLDDNTGRRRASLLEADKEVGSVEWNVREDTRLLDAVEMFGFGNWKDIAKHIETKSDVQVKERYIKCYITGVVGKYTWSEDTMLTVDFLLLSYCSGNMKTIVFCVPESTSTTLVFRK